MVLTPGNDVVEVVAGGDRGSGRQQQHSSGCMNRPGFCSSESSKKCSKGSVKRARGESSSANLMLRSCMSRSLPNSDPLREG
jgi:hypothetical protein